MLKPYFFLPIRLVVLLTSFLLFSAELKAVDIIGADIYYEYVSPMNYRVHLIKHRDCAGAPLTSMTDSITVTSVMQSTSFRVSIDTVGVNDPLNGTYRSNLTPNFSTTCVDPQSQYTGWQYFHLAGIITLPSASSDWEFQWTGDSRGANIMNVVDSTICLRAGLNNMNRPNNSIRLTSAPYLNLKTNQPFTYLCSPADPDLDSIRFSNLTPSSINVNTPTACINGQYIAPYSITNSMATVNPFQLIPSTGVVTFTPNLAGKFVLKFRATDYDPITSDMVGFVERELQFHFYIPVPQSLNENEKLNKALTLYPNPVAHTLNIKLANSSNQSAEVTIYNSFGQKVFSANMNTSSPLQVDFLPAGFYYAEIQVGEQSYRKLFIKE